MSQFQSLTPQEVLLKRDDPGVVVVDVRTDPEYNDAHIPGALHLPLHELEELADEKLSIDDDIVLYCQHGIRSEKAATYLVSVGFRKVAHLNGGLVHWRGPLESE